MTAIELEEVVLEIAALEKERADLTAEAQRREAEMRAKQDAHNAWATQTNTRLIEIQGGFKSCNRLLKANEPQP